VSTQNETAVNLLPRRAVVLHRSRRAKRVWACVLGVVAPPALALVLMGQLGGSGESDSLQSRIAALDLEIRTRVERLEPEASNDPAPVFHEMDSSPDEWAGVLRALAMLAGEEIGFSKLEIGIDPISRTIISVEGRAADSRHVLAFASEVERTGLFMPMSAPEITPDQGLAGVRFTLGVKIDAVATAEGGQE